MWFDFLQRGPEPAFGNLAGSAVADLAAGPQSIGNGAPRRREGGTLSVEHGQVVLQFPAGRSSHGDDGDGRSPSSPAAPTPFRRIAVVSGAARCLSHHDRPDDARQLYTVANNGTYYAGPNSNQTDPPVNARSTWA